MAIRIFYASDLCMGVCTGLLLSMLDIFSLILPFCFQEIVKSFSVYVASVMSGPPAALCMFCEDVNALF